jgi:hypothetical protein
MTFRGSKGVAGGVKRRVLDAVKVRRELDVSSQSAHTRSQPTYGEPS